VGDPDVVQKRQYAGDRFQKFFANSGNESEPGSTASGEHTRLGRGRVFYVQRYRVVCLTLRLLDSSNQESKECVGQTCKWAVFGH